MNERTTALIIVIPSVILLIIIASIIIFNKGSPNEFTFEDEYKVVKLSEREYLIKGFVGEAPLNLKLIADPRNVKDIPSEENIKNKLFPTSQIFITLKPNLTSTSVIAATEISKITGHASLFNIPTKGALTEDSDNGAVPKITCSDATYEEKVIHLKLSEETKISSENNCIVIEGETEYDLIRASDKLVLQLLEIL